MDAIYLCCGLQHNPTASGQGTVCVLTCPCPSQSVVTVWAVAPPSPAPAQLGPRRLGRKCWGDRHLDGGGSHPGLGICQLGNEQLPDQRGVAKALIS